MSQKRFEGRIALVTGATRGIGRAIALQLASEGAHVIAAGRTQGALEELDDEIKAAGGAATLVKLDLRKAAEVDALGPTLYSRWGHLDILMASAGVLGPLSPLGHVSDADWAEVIDINLTANWRLIRSLDPLLRLAPAGRAEFFEILAGTWSPAISAQAQPPAISRIVTLASTTGTLRFRPRAWSAWGIDVAGCSLSLHIRAVHAPVRFQCRLYGKKSGHEQTVGAGDDTGATAVDIHGKRT